MATVSLCCEDRGLRSRIDFIPADEREGGGRDLTVLRLGDGQVEVMYFVRNDQLADLVDVIQAHLVRQMTSGD